MKPRRLDLDYVRPLHRPAWPGLALLAAAVVLAADLPLSYREAHRELAALRAARHAAGPERATRQPSRAGVDAQWKDAEAALRQLSLPWATLIEAVESATTADVALLQLQPDAPQQVLRLTAEARDREAMFEYLRRLAVLHPFAEVHLASHLLMLEDPLRPMQFSAQAAMRSSP